MNKLLPCQCGGKAEFVEGYDTLKIKCNSCGKETQTIYGDYYDEGFMLGTYGNQLTEKWNTKFEQKV